jgi:hypothetical protein
MLSLHSYTWQANLQKNTHIYRSQQKSPFGFFLSFIFLIFPYLVFTSTTTLTLHGLYNTTPLCTLHDSDWKLSVHNQLTWSPVSLFGQYWNIIYNIQYIHNIELVKLFWFFSLSLIFLQLQRPVRWRWDIYRKLQRKPSFKTMPETGVNWHEMGIWQYWHQISQKSQNLVRIVARRKCDDKRCFSLIVNGNMWSNSWIKQKLPKTHLKFPPQKDFHLKFTLTSSVLSKECYNKESNRKRNQKTNQQTKKNKTTQNSRTAGNQTVVTQNNLPPSAQNFSCERLHFSLSSL